MHLRSLSTLLVGSIEETTSGFLNLTPQNSTSRLAMSIFPDGNTRISS
jgi:hypothetical protein